MKAPGQSLLQFETIAMLTLAEDGRSIDQSKAKGACLAELEADDLPTDFSRVLLKNWSSFSGLTGRVT